MRSDVRSTLVGFQWPPHNRYVKQRVAMAEDVSVGEIVRTIDADDALTIHVECDGEFGTIDADDAYPDHAQASGGRLAAGLPPISDFFRATARESPYPHHAPFFDGPLRHATEESLYPVYGTEIDGRRPDDPPRTRISLHGTEIDARRCGSALRTRISVRETENDGRAGSERPKSPISIHAE